MMQEILDEMMRSLNAQIAAMPPPPPGYYYGPEFSDIEEKDGTFYFDMRITLLPIQRE